MSKAREDIYEQAEDLRAGTQALAAAAPDDVVLEQPYALYDEWSGDGVAYEAGDVDAGGRGFAVDAHRGPGAGVAGVDPADRRAQRVREGRQGHARRQALDLRRGRQHLGAGRLRLDGAG